MSRDQATKTYEKGYDQRDGQHEQTCRPSAFRAGPPLPRKGKPHIDVAFDRHGGPQRKRSGSTVMRPSYKCTSARPPASDRRNRLKHDDRDVGTTARWSPRAPALAP
jgi:hypothetical protein